MQLMAAGDKWCVAAPFASVLMRHDPGTDHPTLAACLSLPRRKGFRFPLHARARTGSCTSRANWATARTARHQILAPAMRSCLRSTWSSSMGPGCRCQRKSVAFVAAVEPGLAVVGVSTKVEGRARMCMTSEGESCGSSVEVGSWHSPPKPNALREGGDRCGRL